MPVGRPTTRREVTAIALALGGVASAVLVGFLMLRVSDSRDVQVRLGDDNFYAGRVSRIAPEIIDRGPVLYSDVAGGDRDIYLNHLGSDPLTGWVAFDARPSESPRSCTLLWVANKEHFELFRITKALGVGELPPDRCAEEFWPADGAGLVTYPVTVANGAISIDLNGQDDSPPSQPGTTSSVAESGATTTR